MAQRLRTQQLALGSNFPSSQTQGLDQAFGRSMSAYKPATQSVTSSIAVVNDDSMWTELPPGPSRVTLILPLSMAAASNIRLTLVADQGLTVSSIAMEAIFLLDGVAPSVQPISALGGTVLGAATNAWTSILLTGSVNVSNTGVLQLRWAQQVSGATATQILAGATLDTVQITN